jgi:hypothetical protein
MIIKNGGSAWESNPPGRVLAPHSGFEVDIWKQAISHQNESLIYHTITDGILV